MQIFHGIDIVAIDGIARLINASRRQFFARSFREHEQRPFELPSREAEYYAGLFAAKEAALKALGLGFGDGASFMDVEVRHAASGQPQILLHGNADARATELKISHWTLSISHSAEYAIASAIGLAT